jgi:hypothetical protein
MDLSLVGVFAGALAEQELSAEDAALLPYWRLVRWEGGWAWVPAIAVSEDAGAIAKAKELMAKGQEKANELADAAKDRGGELLDAAKEKSSEKAQAFYLIMLIPAALVALVALLLTAAAATRRLAVLNPLRRIFGAVAVWVAPVVAAASFFTMPGSAPWWAWLVAAGVLVVAAGPAVMVLRRLAKRLNARLIAREQAAEPDVTEVGSAAVKTDHESEESTHGW